MKFASVIPGDWQQRVCRKLDPSCLHDGRCLTLEDTVEFFNLVLDLQLSAEEKQDLAAFLKVL